MVIEIWEANKYINNSKTLLMFNYHQKNWNEMYLYLSLWWVVAYAGFKFG